MTPEQPVQIAGTVGIPGLRASRPRCQLQLATARSIHASWVSHAAAQRPFQMHRFRSCSVPGGLVHSFSTSDYIRYSDGVVKPVRLKKYLVCYAVRAVVVKYRLSRGPRGSRPSHGHAVEVRTRHGSHTRHTTPGGLSSYGTLSQSITQYSPRTRSRDHLNPVITHITLSEPVGNF